MNRRLKHMAERAALLSGIATVSRRLRRGRALVLAYHNVVPPSMQPEGDLSLHLRQEIFAKQLDCLVELCDVVSLTTLVDSPPAETTRPRVAITFDDAYLGAATVGLDELARRGMPSTVFVAPGLLGEEAWWDRVARSRNGEIAADTRATWLEQLAGDGDAILHQLSHTGTRPVALPPPTSTQISPAELLAELVTRTGVSIGSHTWSHRNLAALSEDDLRSELARPIQWLRDRFSSFVPYLTYPYGLSSHAVEDAALHAGYRGAFRVDGGWLPENPGTQRFALPRLNIASGLSVDGFRLRLSGIGAA